MTERYTFDLFLGDLATQIPEATIMLLAGAIQVIRQCDAIFFEDTGIHLWQVLATYLDNLR